MSAQDTWCALAQTQQKARVLSPSLPVPLARQELV